MLSKQHNKSSPLNSTHYAMLYAQNGDRIVAVDSVTSLHTTGAVPANQPVSGGEATDRRKSFRRKMADCPS